uniref:Uncharacterized protein n=2 Tax=Natrinema zhouii TaxID=1710539 RepID=A0A7D6CNV5_9EURY
MLVTALLEAILAICIWVIVRENEKGEQKPIIDRLSEIVNQIEFKIAEKED